MAERSTTRANASETTRTQLVNVASDLFIRKGYASVSVRDIAAACGLTIGAIYSQFRNKADLLVAAIGERLRAELEGNDTYVATRVLPDRDSESDPTTSLEHQLFTMFERYPRRATLRALLLAGAAAATGDDEVRDRLAAEQRHHLEWWFEVYREWARLHGVDKSVDMDSLVTYMWSAELGLAMLEAWGIKPPPPKKWRAVTERLLRSVQNHAGNGASRATRTTRTTRSR
jgi:AcrR family transcriptional regulator